MNDELIRLRDHLETVKRSIRALDCGDHYCRYCGGGTHNRWVHSQYCVYDQSVKDVEIAREWLADLDVLLTALPPPRQEKTEETKDDPRNPASVLRSDPEPTR